MELSLDTNKCTGCGTCLSFCPWEALRLPLFNTPEIEAELRVLLSQEDARPKSLIFTCTCSSALWRRVAPQESPSGELIEYPLPCLGMASPYLMVRAFTLGASSIVLATRESCPYGFKREQIRQRVEVVRHILTSWEQDPERLQVLNVDNTEKLTSQALPPLNLRRYKKPIFTDLDLNRMTWQSNHLGSLMKQIALQAPPAKKHPLTNAQVPLAIAHVDSSLCTLCGLCAERCPAAAITIKRVDDLELTFQYDKCVGCGSCEVICPEKCLRLTQTLDPAHLLAEKEILCRGEMINCRLCGSFITSQKTANKILQATQLSDKDPSSYTWGLCPACRPKAFLQ